MITVHKESIPLSILDDGPYGVRFPIGATLLSTQPQHGEVAIWYLCESDMVGTELHMVSLVGTGKAAPTDAKFLGTCQFSNGHTVVHVFVRDPR